MTSRSIRIAMLVTDSNEGSGFTRRDFSLPSPVLHPAIHNLLNGLQNYPEIEIQIVYGKANPEADEVRQEGNLTYVPVPYRALPLPGTPGVFVGRAMAILRYLRSLKPDMIHAQGSERECGLVAALAGIPSILTLHGNLNQIARTIKAPRFSYFWFAARLENFSVKRVSCVHCISEHTKRCVATSAQRTWVIPNAVASSYFTLKRRPSGEPFVICIADITEWKNSLLLATASDAMHAEFPASEIHFHGACDPNRPYAKAFLDAISNRPWCVAHGNSTHQILAEALSRATCAVLPSTQENFGLALAEAMAAGVPCIGSDAGGIPDIITDRETGLLFPSGDVAALAERLLEIHRNPGLANALAVAGRHDARTRFTVDVVAEAHVAMYRELVSSLQP